MDEEQTAIPVPEPPPSPKVCAWCGAPAVDELEIQPAQHTHRKTGKGGKTIKVLKRAAIVAPVCRVHATSIVLAERGE